ncbi:putative Holliday junction resolvase [Yalta virus]|nr:putative Holliday junction resolvase [Yalta virus]
MDKEDILERKYLCFDIGYVKPGIVLITQNMKNNRIKIEIYDNISFKTNLDCVCVLDYFFSQKITAVVIEQQVTIKNISLMQFIHGYSLGKNVNVVIKRAVSYLRSKQSEEKTSRSIKKGFSVEYFNNLLSKNGIKRKYLLRDSDICDAINIGLIHIFDLNKKNMNSVDIKIDNISHLGLNYDP